MADKKPHGKAGRGNKGNLRPPWKPGSPETQRDALTLDQYFTGKIPELLPADYCQRRLPFTSSGGRTESIWKCDIQLGCKALRLKATHADQVLYVHLGKMAVEK